MKTNKIKTTLKQLDNLPLPDKNKILASCSESPAVTENNYYMPTCRKSKLKPILAACLALLLMLGGFSGYFIAVEAKEYNEAVTFFNEYGLSIDGLSRSEIKNIYQDITTGKFAYGKTAEVIEKNVGGYEIFQNAPTPEDLENLWNYKMGYSNDLHYIINSSNNKDESYKYEYVYSADTSLGFDTLDKTVIIKLVEGKEVWTAEFKNFIVEDYLISENSVVLYGVTSTWSSTQTTHGRIAMLSADGKILWDKTTSNDFDNEYIASILYEDNGIAVFSRGDLKYLCLSKYDMNGNVISFIKNEVGNFGIRNVAKLGDGYIAQLGNQTTGESLVKINADGSLSDSFTYTSDEEEYFITDIIEFGGNVYLSSYSVPKLDDGESTAGGRYDIAAILNYIFDNEYFEISNEELTKLVRDNFTAVLLVCNPESGLPQEFYSVKGSLGGKLAMNDTGMLLWNVESITDTFFSPMTSSFTIGGASYVYRYTFDVTGKIISQEKTGEVLNFIR
ncbi:MAG: hypothetical protein A2Y15_06135 [Clostridiales bacterium GWF2_36_10]|nr:MAG: hypothetical protein A2Y15_06135 [Clostridiales bacterium GWF2_36_10]HAN21905.1 hypothetical protein [Clostridiales bacterium]